MPRNSASRVTEPALPGPPEVVIAGRKLAALLALYFFWGTTYLTIRMALETFPPLILMAVRFVASGTIMLIAARYAGVQLPRGRELWMTAFWGLILLGGGNACLTFSDLWVSSGTAALLITTSPFWMVGLSAALNKDRLHAPTLLGMLVGLGGVLLLIGPAITGARIEGNLIKGFFLLQLGSFCWCFGALMQKRMPTTAHPIVGGAIQQLAVGLFFLPFAVFVPAHPIHWQTRGVLALVYLIIFGSIVGYSAFVYCMEHLPVAVVSTHTYVNPVVAVILGWIFYREPFGYREAAAMAAVFTGVAIVKYYSGRQAEAK